MAVVAMTLAAAAVTFTIAGDIRSDRGFAPRLTAAAVHAVDHVAADHDGKVTTAVSATPSKAALPITQTPVLKLAAPPAPPLTPAPQTPVPNPTAPPITSAAVTPVLVPAAPPVASAAIPDVSALVAQVEAAGIAPGSNWSWSMGNTASHCAVMSGAGTACTYGEAGLEHTIFAGSPNLALVAHEMANAETQNDAAPSLLSEVATAEAGSSWSPTDAVASCLVEHFMGFQDDAAGAWQCPPALGTIVAENIHNTV